jgi:uncharacterized oligopeptide transporter (OPT) family protein
MAIKTLTEEQIRTWTREQKDRWWLENIYRGDMPQLTLRSALTGFVLGGLLSATNLYIGAKTGWTLGVGLTSVILAFATYKLSATVDRASISSSLVRTCVALLFALVGVGLVIGGVILTFTKSRWWLAMSVIGGLLIADGIRRWRTRDLGREFTILENNASQSVATSAGYMTGPLISGIAAYMMVTNVVMPWHQMLLFNVVLSILGVLVAFPMKRRFINDEQAPFPEGAACGVVLDTLYTSDAKVGLFKAKALAAAALLAGGLKFLSGEAYQIFLQCRLLGRDTAYYLSEHLDAWYYKLVAAGKANIIPLNGIDIRKLGLSPTLDLAMFGAGGLMNIRYAINMFAGLIVAYVVAAPIAIGNGWVSKKGQVLTAASDFGYRDVLTGWLLWPGVAMLVCASMTAFLAKPKVIIDAFAGLFGKKQAGTDVLSHIELPLKVSWIGIPIVGAIGVWMAHDWFGVHWGLGALAIALTVVLTLIAANATAATSITPTGSLSKITQFTFGVLDKGHPPTNLMTACMTVEVASNASNLLMDIKPGYMLGAKPRQQVWGHLIGIIAGACASTPLFYVMFMNEYKPGDKITETLISEKFSFTAAVQWKGISEFITGLTGEGGLTKIIHPSALWVMAAAAVVGAGFELVRVFTKGKFPFAPVAFALGVVLPPDSTFWMFLGALFFWGCKKIWGHAKETFANRLLVETHEPICAGLIAGAALIGIGDILVKAFVL